MGASQAHSARRPREAVVLHWLLRGAVLGCFLGHGAFGILTKAEWLPLFEVFHIPEALAWRLMPLVGAMDIVTGLVSFFWPCRIVLAWAASWALWTALLRPMSGMSFLETIERAGNYGIPLALLMSTTTTASGLRAWLGRLEPRALTPALGRRLTFLLLCTTSLLLLGHGGFGVFLVKDRLVQHWASIGLGLSNGIAFVRLVGTFEIVVALLVLVYPSRYLLIGIAAWKLFTESLYPIAGAPIFETIERAGSYAAPLGALVVLAWVDRVRREKDLLRRPAAEGRCGNTASPP